MSPGPSRARCPAYPEISNHTPLWLLPGPNLQPCAYAGTPHGAGTVVSSGPQLCRRPNLENGYFPTANQSLGHPFGVSGLRGPRDWEERCMTYEDLVDYVCVRTCGCLDATVSDFSWRRIRVCIYKQGGIFINGRYTSRLLRLATPSITIKDNSFSLLNKAHIHSSLTILKHGNSYAPSPQHPYIRLGHCRSVPRFLAYQIFALVTHHNFGARTRTPVRRPGNRFTLFRGANCSTNGIAGEGQGEDDDGGGNAVCIRRWSADSDLSRQWEHGESK